MSNIPIYNDCNMEKEHRYLHPKLENILKSTYGVVFTRPSYANYTSLARFTAGEADILKRAMEKKRVELEKQKARFIDGAYPKWYSQRCCCKHF